jgi:hypothetical protein
MSEKKGRLQTIMDAVGDAVQAVAAEVGLTEPEPTPVPQPKAVRKSARKAAVAKVESAQVAAKRARVATRRGR